MGVMKRSRDIINSNINAALDRVEEPAKIVRLVIREMEDALRGLRSSCAARISEKVRIEQELEQARGSVSRWAERSVLAVKEGRDDLAKDALLEKKKAESHEKFMESDLEHLEKIITETRDNIQELETKLEAAVQKQFILIQRGVHARETLRVNKSIRQAGSSSTVLRFDEMERNIERMEAEAELSGSKTFSASERTFQDLETEKSVNEELEALKKSSKATAAK